MGTAPGGVSSSGTSFSHDPWPPHRISHVSTDTAAAGMRISLAAGVGMVSYDGSVQSSHGQHAAMHSTHEGSHWAHSGHQQHAVHVAPAQCRHWWRVGEP